MMSFLTLQQHQGSIISGRNNVCISQDLARVVTNHSVPKIGCTGQILLTVEMTLIAYSWVPMSEVKA